MIKLKVLEKSVLKVFDENNNEYFFSEKKVDLYSHKYSSAHKPSVTLFLDGKPLTGNKKHKRKVVYKCTCGQIHTIDLGKFLSKNKMSCVSCRETEEKIMWHKLYFNMIKNEAT